MKKILSGLLFGTIIVSLTAGKANAQLAKANAATSNYYLAAADTKAGTKAAKEDVKALKANAKALENFKKDFKDEADVTWTAGRETISAYVYRNDVQTRVIYDKKGNRIHALLYYQEDKMPAEVKSAVNRAYPKYDISGVQEIQEDGKTFYVVHIENEKCFKEVTFFDGEVNTYKEFNKAQ